MCKTKMGKVFRLSFESYSPFLRKREILAHRVNKDDEVNQKERTVTALVACRSHKKRAFFSKALLYCSYPILEFHFIQQYE